MNCNGDGCVNVTKVGATGTSRNCWAKNDVQTEGCKMYDDEEICVCFTELCNFGQAQNQETLRPHTTATTPTTASTILISIAAAKTTQNQEALRSHTTATTPTKVSNILTSIAAAKTTQNQEALRSHTTATTPTTASTILISIAAAKIFT